MVRIVWLPPLDRVGGPVTEIELGGPTPLTRVLGDLAREVPGFAPYARFGEKDHQPQGLLVLRRGHVLTLADELAPGDEVEMLIMVAGG